MPELDALLALLLLQDARRAARTDAAGEVVLLQDQDRSRWDRDQIAEGVALITRALRSAPPGPYALEAAIAAVHAEAPSAEATDWSEIAALYERLAALHPSPVVALNGAVALAMAEGPERGLAAVDALGPELRRYHLWHAARAELLGRVGRVVEALDAYGRAHALCGNDAERRFLASRADALRRCVAPRG